MDDNYLNDVWSLYFHDPYDMNWEANSYKFITTISSIEDFVNVYKSFNDLWIRGMFFIMREHITPRWEDDNNKNGGKITIILKKNTNIELLNNLWLNTLLACIGNNFYDDEYDINPICGIVLNIRKHQNRINIWINTSDEQSVNNISNILFISLNQFVHCV